MSTSLVPAPQSGPLATMQDIASAIPLIPEYVEIAQVGTRVQGKIPGQFINKQTGVHYKEFRAIPFAFATNRVKYAQGAGFGTKPECRSNDGIVPAPNVVDKKSDKCATCPYSQWKVVGGQKIKPGCSKQVVLLFQDEITFGVFKFKAKGTSVAPLEKAVKQIGQILIREQQKQQYLANKAKAEGKEFVPTPLDLDAFVIELKITEVINDKGTYYNLLALPKQRSEEDVEMFHPTYLETKLRLAAGAAQAQSDDEEDVVDQALNQELGATQQEYVSDPVIDA